MLGRGRRLRGRSEGARRQRKRRWRKGCAWRGQRGQGKAGFLRRCIRGVRRERARSKERSERARPRMWRWLAGGVAAKEATRKRRVLGEGGAEAEGAELRRRKGGFGE